MYELMRIAAADLARFLAANLPDLSGTWWQDCVVDQLSFQQQRGLKEQGQTRLDQLDFAALLRVFDQNWYRLSDKLSLPKDGRNWVKELQTVRNKWAHLSSQELPPSEVYRDADTLDRLLRLVGASPESLSAVEATKNAMLQQLVDKTSKGHDDTAVQSIPATSSETNSTTEVRNVKVAASKRTTSLHDEVFTPRSVSAANSNDTVMQEDGAIFKPAGSEEVRSSPPYTLRSNAESCTICQYVGESCDLASLRGTIQSLSTGHVHSPGEGLLRIATEEGFSVSLHVQNRYFSQVLPLLEKVLSQQQADGPSRGMTVAAFHLKQQAERDFVATSDSLVILEPEWLIDVTDLTKVEYCPRQYLIDRLKLSTVNHHMVRGNIVHRTFEQMIRTPHDGKAIVKALESAFREQVTDLAILNQTKLSTWEEVRPHYNLLKQWAIEEDLPSSVQSEIFLLTPEIGMKGKIDAVWWSQDGYLSHIGELKTSKSFGPEPKPGHAFQAGAYSLMTHLRGWGSSSNQKVWLLYSGNSSLSGSLNIKRQLHFTIETAQEAAKHRNSLVLADYLVDAPFETENLKKCQKCTIAGDCRAVALLLNHLDPRPSEIQSLSNAVNDLSETEISWFQSYIRLLAQEYRVVKESHAALWQKTPAERCDDGTTIIVTKTHDGLPPDPGGPGIDGRYIYDLLSDVQSELREDDVVLVSDSEGPARGRIAQGTVRSPLENGLSVEFRRPLDFEPHYVDRYVTENLVERQFAGPYSWLHLPKEYRDLVIRQRRPRFEPVPGAASVPRRAGSHLLNDRQNLAVQMALEMQDYLLIQGPPGSGKTMLIVALVREFLSKGKKVLLAAGTNTAVDNMLKPLIDAGLGDDLLRLGTLGRTDNAIREYLPETLAKHDDLDTYIQQLRGVLTARRIVAATATSWLSGPWGLVSQFDVAIVDEAAQLTVPATLGPLRLVSKFILIGDHMQLPAVVHSESGTRRDYLDRDSSPRLSTSLFELLYKDLDRTETLGLVKLNEQYRMNEEICAIPCHLGWYDELKPATDQIASAKLALRTAVQTNHPLFRILDPDEKVVFVDVPWLEHGGNARANKKEAKLVCEIIRTYLDHGLSIKSVGVIAPFRAQVALIRRLLESSLPKADRTDIRVGVDTVDRFQGQQRELMIISLATFSDYVHELLLDERRLNVALTRAKHKLIILGDTSVLRKHRTYLRLIEQCSLVRLLSDVQRV